MHATSRPTKRAFEVERLRAALMRVIKDDSAILMTLTLATGVVGGLIAFAFHWISHGLLALIFPGAPEGVVAAMRASPPWLRVLMPALGGLAAGSIRWLWGSGGKARGMPEVLEAVTMGGGILKVRRATPMAMSSLVTFTTGGSVGREGAIVQLTAALASRLGRTARIDRTRLRMLVGCGVAAGTAAAYRTPIGGALFALEVIYNRFALDELGPIVVSSVAATLTSYLLMGESPLYAVPEFSLRTPYEVLPYLALGVLCGPMAVLFQRMLDISDRLYRGTGLPLPLRSAAGGAMVGLLATGVPEVAGNGYEGLTVALGGHAPLVLFILLLGGKLVATAMTVGSGGAGGVFTPTLLVGASAGGVVGWAAHAWLPRHAADPASYALVGMGALLAATTRAPIMAILVVFEMTRQYAMVPPLMLAAVAASAAARLLERDSIYAAELRRHGIVLEGQREVDILSQRQVRDIVRANVPLIPETLPFDTLLRIFRQTRELFLYVGDGSGRLVGVIDLHDMKDFLGESGLGSLILASDLIRPVRPITPDATLLEAERRLRYREVGQLAVVDDLDDMRYLGIVTRKDLLAAVERARVIDEGETLPAAVEEESARGRLEYLPVQDALAGRKASEVTDEMVGGEVLAVRRSSGDGASSLLSARDAVLAKGDVLVILPSA